MDDYDAKAMLIVLGSFFILVGTVFLILWLCGVGVPAITFIVPYALVGVGLLLGGIIAATYYLAEWLRSR